MRILYINYLSLKDGSNIHVKSFADAVNAIGYDIESLWHNIDDNKPNTKGNINYKKSILGSTKLKGFMSEVKMVIENLRYMPKEFAMIKKGKYDVLIVRYAFNIFSSVLIAKLLRHPLILEVNSPSYYEQTQLFGRQLWRLSALIERWILKNASMVVTVSDELKDMFVNQGISDEKIAVVYNGVETHRFYPRKKNKNLAKKLGIPLDAFVVGFSGSFQKWHGVNNILKIAEYLNNSEVYFMLVGDGFVRQEIESHVRNRGIKNVIFCGSVSYEKMPQYLSLFDVAVAPYPNLKKFYFSPLKIFEYMAMGIPTIAPNLGQIGRVINNNENGILVQPGRYDFFANEISRLMESDQDRKVIGRCASQMAHSKMDWTLTAEKYIHIIKTII